MQITLKEFNEILGQTNSIYHEANLKLGVSDSEAEILYILSTHEPGCYQSTIYKESFLTKSTINSALKKMEKKELLYLTPGGGRNTRIYLTEKGMELSKNTAWKIIEMENKVYETWSKEEQETFLRLNRDFAEKMTALVKQL